MSCRIASFLFKEINKNNTMKTVPYEMVRLEGETLNQLFSVLEEWNVSFKGCFEKSSASASLTEFPLGPSP